ncbi:hypothetical protein BDC45DRAFT_534565 [Circinella umbellata]|nr:hypothetical protein BDC45DRAFT_534565 [Circinella umbellata]
MLRRSDQQSLASSSRQNEERYLSSDGSIKKILGVKPDMLIAKDMLEFGSAEQGYFDGNRTMKDMLLLGSEMYNNENCFQTLRVILVNLRVTPLVMNVSDGYICRVKPLKQQKISMELANFYDIFIPFLMDVYKMKDVVKKASKNIIKAGSCSSDKDDDEDNSGEKRSGFASVKEN